MPSQVVMHSLCDKFLSCDPFSYCDPFLGKKWQFSAILANLVIHFGQTMPNGSQLESGLQLWPAYPKSINYLIGLGQRPHVMEKLFFINTDKESSQFMTSFNNTLIERIVSYNNLKQPGGDICVVGIVPIRVDCYCCAVSRARPCSSSMCTDTIIHSNSL